MKLEFLNQEVMGTITVSIPLKLKAEAMALKTNQGVKLSDLVKAALIEYIGTRSITDNKQSMTETTDPVQFGLSKKSKKKS
ncbi:MAG: hypothetical protein PVG39_11320 [Desulfobacteraceae bacterium]